MESSIKLEFQIFAQVKFVEVIDTHLPTFFILEHAKMI